MKLRILLADDHVLFRKGIASLLSERKDLEVVGEAGDGCEAERMARDVMPDLILMDVHMPNCNGLEAVRAIRRWNTSAKIIMLTADEDDDMLFDAIKSGAQGYLPKKLTPQQLYEWLEAVSRGEVGLSPSMLAKILSEFQRPEPSAAEGDLMQESLTPRELDVLQQVAGGASNREIAEALSITDNTVKKHLQSILAKLHLQNRVQAAVYAVREGMVDEKTTKDYPIG